MLWFMRTLTLIVALNLIAWLAWPSPCMAAPPRPLITLSSGDVQELVKTLNIWLDKLPPGAASLLPAGVASLARQLPKLPVSGPGTLVILGKPGSGGALAVTLTSKQPATLKKKAAALLGPAGRKMLRLKTRGQRVYMESAPWAGKWLRARAAKLEAPLMGQTPRFRFQIHLDAFIPGTRGMPSLHPLELTGQLPNDWSYVGGPVVTAALKPLLTRVAPREMLGLVPGGVRLVCSLPMTGLNALTKSVTGGKLSGTGAGDLVVARLPDSPTAIRMGLYWSDAKGKASAMADQLYEMAGKLLPRISKALDAQLKLKKVKGGGYALIYPISLAHRAALAALGFKVPYPLVIQWRARGKVLILANDPLFLNPKEGFTRELPARLRGAAAHCWLPGEGRSTRLVWRPDGVRVESDALTSGKDLMEQTLLSFPATLLSGMIKRKVVEVFKIPMDSMTPTILPGDHIWVDRRTAGKLPGKGEIVVFRFPQDPKRDLLKRVVALPGETVQVKGKLGEKGSVPLKVPPGHVFVMGDNRDNSFDSRHFGPVKVASIKGRACSVFWSSDEKGKVRWERIGKHIK